MTREDPDEQEFIRGYTNVLVTAWSDADYAERLENDPAAALGEVGLPVPSGVVVELIRDEPKADGRSSRECLQDQYQMWLAGEQTGVARLHVPYTPVVATSSLSLDELETISGGGPVMCCCCPCSCSL